MMPEQTNSRPKTWDELDVAEKIERMRDIIKFLQRDNDTLTTIIGKLLKHKHAGDDVVSPITRYEESGIKGYCGTKEWF